MTDLIDVISEPERLREGPEGLALPSARREISIFSMSLCMNELCISDYFIRQCIYGHMSLCIHSLYT